RRCCHRARLARPQCSRLGQKENWQPSRQVAFGLTKAGIPVRWCDTHGEQCHSTLMLTRPINGPAELLLGSANFTRRNLDNLNLETNVVLVGATDTPAITDAAAFFDLRWLNAPNQNFSRPYAYYADDSRWRY